MHTENRQARNLQTINRQKTTSILVILGCLYLYIGTNTAEAKNETFYGCKNGFQFESKQQAARCIKQQRLSFQAPQQCNKKAKFFQLKVDFRGNQDMCIAKNTINLQNEMKQNPKPGTPRLKSRTLNKKTVSFSPKCPIGFQLQIRKGKDACSRGKPEQVIAPSKKVKR